MKTVVFIAGLIVLPLISSAEVPPPPEKLEVFVAAIVENGCRMTDDEAEAKFPALGINKEESNEMAEFLIDTGSAEVIDDTISLSKENCP